MTHDDVVRSIHGSYNDATQNFSVNNFNLEIVKGDVDGYSTINKFGLNENLNTSTFEDIWDVGGVYNYPADNTSPITYLGSDDNNDTEPIEIQGLDENGGLTNQTVTLQGTTHVILPIPLWRIFRMKNAGSNNLSGKVHASNTADNIVYAQIENGNNQTLMALYTIPAGKTGYLVQAGASLHGLTTAYSVDGHFFIRQFGGVFQLKSTFALQTDGTSAIDKPFKLPLRINEKSDLKVNAISTKNGGSLTATFDIILIDN